MAAGAHVREVGEMEFERDVLEASRELPVVVDFWAGWCRPCLVLGPVLERLAEEYGGRFRLAKVDVDANPALSGAFGIQGIPAVKAFRDGRVVAEFTGAQPEAVVRRFLDGIAPDRSALEPAKDAEESGDMEAAERAYREALGSVPGDGDASVGLARVLLARGEAEEARRLLSDALGREDARQLLAELDLRELAGEPGEMGAAARAALGGDHAAALESCLSALADESSRDAARQTMVTIFDLLGDEHPLTREYRPRLARALF